MMFVTLHQLCQSKNLSFLKHLNFNDVLFLTPLIVEFLIEILFFINENVIDNVKCIKFVIKSSTEFDVMMFIKVNCEFELRERKLNIFLKILLNFTSSRRDDFFISSIFSLIRLKAVIILRLMIMTFSSSCSVVIIFFLLYHFVNVDNVDSQSHEKNYAIFVYSFFNFHASATRIFNLLLNFN